MRKERLARGWSLREFAARSGVDIATASLIENGKRPPNENVAKACDAVFPERNGYFLELYEEMQEWLEVPAALKDWTEREEKTETLRDWWPSFVSGLLQTEDYARAQLRTYPGVSDEIVATRLANRMERQRRVLYRDDPPEAWFVVDEMALYRYVGSAEVMAVQMRHLAEVASLPNVTMQVLPAVAHPVGASGFILADDAAYVEHVMGGFTYVGETASSLSRMMTTILSESYRASESLAMMKRMEQTWTRGVRAATATPTVARASRSRQQTA
jgi:transcriptional regulator with XRE-family HTH domain